MHCSVPFDIRGLSITDFSIVGGPGTNPLQILRDTEVWGQSNVILRFFTAGRGWGSGTEEAVCLP